MMLDPTGYKEANQVSDQTLLNILMLIMFTCLVWLLTGCEAKQVPHYTNCLRHLLPRCSDEMMIFCYLMLPSQAVVSSNRIHSSVIMMSIPELALFIPLFIPEAEIDDTLLLIFSRVLRCKSLKFAHPQATIWFCVLYMIGYAMA